ncbi:hypothetical protein BMS3Abin07_02627 [bacterium BMS3Abin07]|nr:hypothetical protein BMS3Abin07_02627 [bacterium BMS3Abin07]GBE31701.1 hypothetical protein BMS3Bbin05_00604 [bacterium BMS3Bbin05]
MEIHGLKLIKNLLKKSVEICGKEEKDIFSRGFTRKNADRKFKSHLKSVPICEYLRLIEVFSL